MIFETLITSAYDVMIWLWVREAETIILHSIVCQTKVSIIIENM
jgi:hypothetical protein